MEENKLVMVFKNTLGNSFSITVDDPKDNLGGTGNNRCYEFDKIKKHIPAKGI